MRKEGFRKTLPSVFISSKDVNNWNFFENDFQSPNHVSELYDPRASQGPIGPLLSLELH